MANLIGQTLLDQFRVDSFVASGGMGAVYRVMDLKRNVPLAMKVLHTELAEDPRAFKGFQREAYALQRLAHPNIVAFYGVYQTLDFTFLLERFIDGPSLKDILRRQQGKPLLVNEVLIYLKALSSALGYAHASGVVHCDVKPGNIMLDQGGNIFLTDFGIARHSDSATTTLAGAGAPAYMAPEQIRGKTVTPSTDVYALGILLFEMLTGQRPFRGNEVGTEKGGTTSNERIRYAHLHLAPPDPHNLNPSLSQDLTIVMLKALEKNPADRYRSTQEFFAALCIAAGINSTRIPDRVVLQSPPPSQPQSRPQPVLSRETTDRPVASPRQISPWLWVGGATLIVVLIMMLAGELGGGGLANLPPSTQAGIELPKSPLGSLADFTPTLIPPNAIDPSTATVAAVLTQAALAQLSVIPTPYILPTDVPILPTATTHSPAGNAINSTTPSGRIVFTCQIAQNANSDQICIMNADGSNWRQLTNNSFENYYPSLSPDGDNVIFASNQTGSFEIYEMDFSGNQQQLTSGVGEPAAPAISPDGTQIVFANNLKDIERIWVMSINGSNPHEVYGNLDGDSLDPSWSSNSRILFAYGSGDNKQLYVINANGTGLSLISSSFHTRGRSSWSPDGSMIAGYSGPSWQREIYLMNADGSNLRQISHGENAQAPIFSPDGQWLAFTGYSSIGNENSCEIYIMRVDGSDIRRLTNNDYCDWQPRWGL